jgi:ubiquinone/menaquinone biosynthesis C-methylase UbiE
MDPEGNEAKHLRRFAAPDGKRVLEVGCGDGRLTAMYANVANHVAGIDLDRDELRIAVIERPSDLVERVQFVQGDATQLPFPKNKFDLAILAWSF